MTSLKKNISYNFIYQLLILFIPFITAPYLSRTIGAYGIGKYSYSFSIATYFLYFAMLGMNNYGNRIIASVKNDFIKLSKSFWELYLMQFSIGVLSIIAYLFFIIFFSKDKTLASIQLLYVVSSLFDINWFFFGIEKFKITVIRNSVIKIISMILIFLFVKNKNDIDIYIFIMASSFLISQLSLWPFLKKNINFLKPSLKDIKKHLKPNLILFIPVISVSIYRIIGKILLGNMINIESVGYFENAEKIISLPIALITAIGTVMLPRMTSLISENKIYESKRYIDKTMFLILAFANASAFGIISIAKDFVEIYYGIEFLETVNIMKVLSITIILLAIGNVIRSQYLIPNKKDKIYITSAILGAIFNLISNIILIPILGAIGTAISTVISELVVCSYQLYKVKNEIKYKLYIKYEAIYFTISIIMYFILNNIHYIENIYTRLIIKILLGCIIFSIFMMVYLKILNIKKKRNNKVVV